MQPEPLKSIWIVVDACALRWSYNIRCLSNQKLELHVCTRLETLKMLHLFSLPIFFTLMSSLLFLFRWVYFCWSQVAMKLAPNREKFMEVVGGTGDINADIEAFCVSFAPLLEENHKFLVRSFLQLLKLRTDHHRLHIYMWVAVLKSLQICLEKIFDISATGTIGREAVLFKSCDGKKYRI